MSYKVTIQDAVLEKCIEPVSINVDTPNHYDMRTDPTNSMIIEGKIDTDEGTALLYKWALLPATNPECYKELTVEYTKDNQLVRKVCFSKAFVVDYSENYSNYSGVGTFTLYVRQFRGKDIECIGQTSRPSAEVSSTVGEDEKEIDVAKQQTPIAATTAARSKSTMSITDKIAKQKEMMDNGITGADKPEIELGKADLDALRKKWKVPETDTIAVGKTDVPGLEGISFEGGSPKVRTEAGFPNYDVSHPDRLIKSSGKIPSATRHAEEVVANEFVEAVEKAGIKSEDVIGTLRIHQSNPSGVCPTCLSGLGNPRKDAGVIKQLSLKYPNLKVDVTSETVEGAQVNGRLAFKVKNGVYID